MADPLLHHRHRRRPRARALDTGMEADSRYAVWGESQGGHAAPWTGQVAAAGSPPELTPLGGGPPRRRPTWAR